MNLRIAKSLFWLQICLFTKPAFAGTISGALNPSEVERLVEVIGLPSTTRMLRSAEPYKLWPGIKFGFEIATIPTKNVNLLGDQRGTVSGLHFLPRIFVAKGLLFNLELIANFFPLSSSSGLSTTGLALKWTALSEEDNPASVAPYLSVTKISGLGGFRGTNVEAGVLASRDLVKFKPYAGAGLVVANGKVINGLTTGNTNSAKEASIHLFFGAEFEFPVNLTFQADFMNVAVSGSIFAGKKF